MSGPAPTVRIIVADDQQVVEAGFAALPGTQPDVTVIGTACDSGLNVPYTREQE
jgi:DNA-binding NarL/FixJ family response regulator